MTIKAIIFDVDGTLADTEDAHRIAFNKAFAENNLPWNWDVALYDKLLKVTGGKERIKYYVESYLPDFNKPADYEGFVKNLHVQKTAHYTATLRDGHIPLRPGIKQLITDAHKAGIRLAIATTTSPENVGCLAGSGIGQGLGQTFRRHRLRRHRAEQEARTGHLQLGAERTEARAAGLHRAGRLLQWLALGAGSRDQDLCHHEPLHAPAGLQRTRRRCSTI